MNQPFTKQESLAIVTDFAKRMALVVAQPLGFPGKARAWSDLHDEIAQFDLALGPGLSIGRQVAWPMPGGADAEYFVIGIGRAYVNVLWLPNSDNAESPVICNGVAMRPAIEQAIAQIDWWRRMFRAQKKATGLS